jgi:hypothetical protein
MFPRFLMPIAMQKAGLFTINAWAIDGFTKVFWRDLPSLRSGRKSRCSSGLVRRSFLLLAASLVGGNLRKRNRRRLDIVQFRASDRQLVGQ